MPPTLEALRRRHPEHIAEVERWKLLEAMVAGGKAMTPEMKRKLLPNPDGRPEEVMQERVKLATYTNKIGPILSRFNSQLFAEKPAISGSKDKFWEKRFFEIGALLNCDDDARASFFTLLSHAMFKGLICGRAIAQVDTRIADDTISLEDQKENGELEPYVVLHPRSALWDWNSDGKGFTFVKLHQFRMRRTSWDQPPIAEHDFTIYQRTETGEVVASRYLVTKRPKAGEKPPEKEFDLEGLKDEDVDILPYQGPGGRPFENLPIFNYQDQVEFPVVTLSVPPQLCIADQLYEPQKSYFCQTAGAEYALYSNNYSMPIITGVDDEDEDPLQNQKMGEGYYLTLKTGQSITSYERSGSSITSAISYRGEIKRDIYDQLQQIAMSASDGAAIIARSAQSKREDRRPEQILLETYGQLIKEFALQILKIAAIAHAESVDWEIDGFDDYLGEGVLEEIADLQGLQQLIIPSPTFKREIAKYLVRRVGKSYDIEGDKVTAALEELDKAPEEKFDPPQPPAMEAEQPPGAEPQPASTAPRSNKKAAATATA